jgi:hypothetical protein
LRDQGLAVDLTDITEDEELDGDQKLSAALLVMNEELPLMWKGEVVTREWMTTNPDQAIELCKSKLPKLYDLHRSGSELNLLEIAERVNEVRGDKAPNGPEREAVVGLVLDENAPLKWGGQEVNAQWLAAKPKEAIKLRQSPVLGWYERLRGRDELVIELQRVRRAEKIKAKRNGEICVKTIKRGDCIELGQDKFDETLNKFLDKFSREQIISMHSMNYACFDSTIQKYLPDYAAMIVYER